MTPSRPCTLQAEMAGSPETAVILEALNSQRADARERQAAMERQIREEARRLRGGVAGIAFPLLLCWSSTAGSGVIASRAIPS